MGFKSLVGYSIRVTVSRAVTVAEAGAGARFQTRIPNAQLGSVSNSAAQSQDRYRDVVGGPVGRPVEKWLALESPQ